MNKEDNITDKNIIDWERLQLFTDGNPDEEKALIEVFIASAGEAIATIKQHIETQDNEEWEITTHRLKGSAANMGAKNLSDICDEAEKAYMENAQTKRILFNSILTSYNKVRDAMLKKIS